MLNYPDNTGEIQVMRDKKGRFVEGISGNIKGKPKGSVNEVTKFKEAIALFEKEQQKSIYDFILKKSLTNPQVLIAIFKALIPQHIETETQVTSLADIYNPYKDMSDEELIEKIEETLARVKSIKNNENEVAEFWKPENKGKTYY